MPLASFVKVGDLPPYQEQALHMLDSIDYAANARLQRFAHAWDRYFRGRLPVKNDTDVTEDDVRRCNLILFGDPGSNRWIAQVLPHLPLTWTKHELEIDGRKYAAADHVAVLIQPNPLAADRYVVLNSGHTFGEKELASLNYLLFPRLGDWAVLNIPAGEPISAGFFDEQWRCAERAPTKNRGLLKALPPPAASASRR